MRHEVGVSVHLPRQGEHRSESKIDMDEGNLSKRARHADVLVPAVSCHNHAFVLTCTPRVSRFVVDVSACLLPMSATIPLLLIKRCTYIKFS
jgi:hypothetical protein